MTPNCTTNNRPVMSGNTDATTQSPDNLARCHGKDHLLPNLMHVAASVFVGTWTVFVNRVVIAKLNEPGHDFLEDHLTFAEFQEYRELTPHSSLFLSQLAVTSTAIYLASGGLCKLCGGCKSILYMMGHALIFQRLMPQQTNLQETVIKPKQLP